MPPEQAFLALGGNIGDVAATFTAACRNIEALPQTRIVARSSLYRTKPWGMSEQPDFLNACLAISTKLASEKLLHEILRIEREHGRDRVDDQRWGPRRLDIDIIAHGDKIIKTERLTLPHPQLFERAFVLVPLAEIAGDSVVAGCKIKDAASRLDAGGVTRLAEAW
jgi:2-amino-4-hydroxy-6-hydroxymethyldihydropteridine diphosphokinase